MEYTSLEAELLDLSLVLHAEHGGGNNSAFTTHVVSSSGTDTYSAISAAVGCLKGPKHGGANIKVQEMMENIKVSVSDWKDEEEVKNHLRKILNKEVFDRSGLIYGMGHAVYTISDPRAVLLKEKAAILAEAKVCKTNLMRNRPRIWRQRCFVKRKGNNKEVIANVDFIRDLYIMH